MTVTHTGGFSTATTDDPVRWDGAVDGTKEGLVSLEGHASFGTAIIHFLIYDDGLGYTRQVINTADNSTQTFDREDDTHVIVSQPVAGLDLWVFFAEGDVARDGLDHFEYWIEFPGQPHDAIDLEVCYQEIPQLELTAINGFTSSHGDISVGCPASPGFHICSVQTYGFGATDITGVTAGWVLLGGPAGPIDSFGFTDQMTAQWWIAPGDVTGFAATRTGDTTGYGVSIETFANEGAFVDTTLDFGEVRTGVAVEVIPAGDHVTAFVDKNIDGQVAFAFWEEIVPTQPPIGFINGLHTGEMPYLTAPGTISTGGRTYYRIFDPGSEQYNQGPGRDQVAILALIYCTPVASPSPVCATDTLISTIPITGGWKVGSEGFVHPA